MESSSDDECPICKETIRNPSEPTQCCRKVFCDSCLRRAILTRPTCPYCRSPDCGSRSVIQRRICLPGIATADPALQTTRPVAPNLQTLISRLRNAQVQAFAVANTLNLDAQNTSHSSATPRGRPVPTPRASAASASSVAPVLNAPVILPDLTSDDLNEMDWQNEANIMEDASGQISSNTVRTYNCPYCQEGGLDDLDLLEHCNANHCNDPRRVVCPVCVSLPHGNPEYFSRDFIGHLNLRHCYYIDNMTNTRRRDEINLQEALLRSYKQ